MKNDSWNKSNGNKYSPSKNQFNHNNSGNKGIFGQGQNSLKYDATHNKLYSKLNDNTYLDLQNGKAKSFMGSDNYRVDTATGHTYSKVNDHMWIDNNTGEMTNIL